MSHLIAPHGGTLVDRMVPASERDTLAAEAAALPRITLSAKQACDLEMIAIGAFSPLTGFVKQADFESICRDMRLADGTIWPIPITLAVDDATRDTLSVGGRAALHHEDGTLLAVVDVEELYPHDRTLEIPSVFRTEDEAHPGVKQVMDEGDWLPGGPRPRAPRRPRGGGRAPAPPLPWAVLKALAKRYNCIRTSAWDKDVLAPGY